MMQKSTPVPTSLFRQLARVMIALAAVLAAIMILAGCSGYEKLAQDTVDKDYTVRGIKWTSGTTTLIFMRAFNNQGKLAICGAYTASKHADLAGEAVRQFFDTANMYIGEERIGPLSFTNSVPWRGVKWVVRDDEIIVTESSEPANCVVTGKDWKEPYGRDPITFQGPTRITVQM